MKQKTKSNSNNNLKKRKSSITFFVYLGLKRPEKNMVSIKKNVCLGLKHAENIMAGIIFFAFLFYLKWLRFSLKKTKKSWSNVCLDSKCQALWCLMAEEIVNKHIILECVYEKTHEKCPNFFKYNFSEFLLVHFFGYKSHSFKTS